MRDAATQRKRRASTVGGGGKRLKVGLEDVPAAPLAGGEGGDEGLRRVVCCGAVIPLFGHSGGGADEDDAGVGQRGQDDAVRAALAAQMRRELLLGAGLGGRPLPEIVDITHDGGVVPMVLPALGDGDGTSERKRPLAGARMHTPGQPDAKKVKRSGTLSAAASGTSIDTTNMTYSDLQQACKARGLKASGTAVTLRNRLQLTSPKR